MIVEKKTRVALIYKKNYTFFNENHFDKTTYYFFMKALKRNNDLDIDFFPVENEFDCKKLKGKTDIILLANNNTDATPEKLIGIKEIGIPVICRTGDPHWAKRYNQIEFHEKWKIDYYFNFMHEDYFYKFYPKKLRYKTIIFGVEPDVYKNLKFDFKNRKKFKIVNSGAMGKNTLKSRMANRVLNPKRSGWYFYKLRTLCNNLEYVTHTRELENELTDLSYPELLSKFRAAIAATTFYPTIKYWETSAAGCLTFMEITEQNNGNYLGYTDGENSIFINEKNYEEKFQEYLSDPDNKKWEQIASSGKEFTMNNFSNDEAVKQLVTLFESMKK